MTRRAPDVVLRRASLPLTAQDDADLALLRRSDALQRSLAGLVAAPVDATMSEAALLHAVFEAGIDAVRRNSEDEGYAQLAADYALHAQERRRLSRRRTPAWSDEP